MADQLPYLPSKEEIIASAKAKGWNHSIRRGCDILEKVNPDVCVILQSIEPGACYAHAVAASYARVLELDIAGGAYPSSSGPGGWSPSDDEQT